MLLGFVLGLVLGVPGTLVAPIVSRGENRAPMVLGAFLGMVVGIVAWSALAGVLTDMSATSPFVLHP
jgi:ammonia channel protein AmtB